LAEARRRAPSRRTQTPKCRERQPLMASTARVGIGRLRSDTPARVGQCPKTESAIHIAPGIADGPQGHDLGGTDRTTGVDLPLPGRRSRRSVTSPGNGGAHETLIVRGTRMTRSARAHKPVGPGSKVAVRRFPDHHGQLGAPKQSVARTSSRSAAQLLIPRRGQGSGVRHGRTVTKTAAVPAANDRPVSHPRVPIVKPRRDRWTDRQCRVLDPTRSRASCRDRERQRAANDKSEVTPPRACHRGRRSPLSEQRQGGGPDLPAPRRARSSKDASAESAPRRSHRALDTAPPGRDEASRGVQPEPPGSRHR